MVNDAVAGRKLGFARDATEHTPSPTPIFLHHRLSAFSQPTMSLQHEKSTRSQLPII